MRHEIFDRWLTEKRSVHYVLEHLKDANFDPELYQQYEHNIVSEFNNTFKTSLTPKKRSWKRILNLTK